ncbi:hypothetical protein CAEBREN_14870 [Caenorhabditis brenneri]|uniref:Uncharacterized protein n=1 Tax=Caenorhabditis brenneri TaxID=135651 RepID=G0P0C3_CAEBE|nr:hypothetical protein CAEBREN_14870 [Caenorhabditis brenneri]
MKTMMKNHLEAKVQEPVLLAQQLQFLQVKFKKIMKTTMKNLLEAKVREPVLPAQQLQSLQV